MEMSGSLQTLGRMALAAVLAVLSIDTAGAEPIDDRIEELLAWLAQQTRYEVHDIKVTAAFASPEVINIVAHGQAYVGQADVAAVAIGSAILLPNWFELGRDDDLLVHELTHVLQHANGATFRCQEEQEREAYETAAAFTEQTGIGAKPSPLFMLFLRCNPNPWERVGAVPVSSPSLGAERSCAPRLQLSRHGIG
jgi:hypothetical protein